MFKDIGCTYLTQYIYVNRMFNYALGQMSSLAKVEASIPEVEIVLMTSQDSSALIGSSCRLLPVTALVLL